MYVSQPNGGAQGGLPRYCWSQRGVRMVVLPRARRWHNFQGLALVVTGSRAACQQSTSARHPLQGRFKTPGRE